MRPNCFALARRCLARRSAGEALLTQRISTSSFLNSQEKIDSGFESDASSLQDIAEAKQLTSIEEFRGDMAPFLKEIFCGNFNTLVMSYPDILPNDRYYNLEEKILEIRECLLDRKDLVNAIDTEHKVSKDILLALRSKGLFGLRGSPKYGGEGFSVTESLRCLEEVAAANLNISNIIVNSSWYAASFLRLYGSEELKEKYLRNIYQGTTIASVCVADEMAGCDANSTNATVFPETTEGKLSMKFDKLWVTNAVNADLLIVMAKEVNRSETMSFPLNAYLVDRQESDGINVDPEATYPTKGLKASGISTIHFNEVKVPKTNQLGGEGEGFHLLTECFKDEAKLASSVQILAALRKTINMTILHATQRKAFGAELKSFDLVHDKIGKSALHLYALESAIYLTAGLADYQKEPEVALESTACKILAYKATQICQEMCRTLFGAETYLNDSSLMSIFNDVEGLHWWESTNDLNKLYVSLGGLAYCGDYRQPRVDKVRNISIFNAFATAKGGRHYVPNPKLVHKIYEDVHPSLIESAKHLEAMYINFDHSLDYFLADHGANVQLAEMDLDRIGNIVANMYGMISALARANRSYCDGHRHGDLEIKMTGAYMLMMEPLVKQEIADLKVSLSKKNDPYIKFVSNYLFEQGGYATVHPVTRTMF